MNEPRPLPAPGLAEVRIVATSPDVARQVAQALRDRYASTEQRSYPVGIGGEGTLLVLTVDISRRPDATVGFQEWLTEGDEGYEAGQEA